MSRLIELEDLTHAAAAVGKRRVNDFLAAECDFRFTDDGTNLVASRWGAYHNEYTVLQIPGADTEAARKDKRRTLLDNDAAESGVGTYNVWVV